MKAWQIKYLACMWCRAAAESALDNRGNTYRCIFCRLDWCAK